MTTQADIDDLARRVLVDLRRGEPVSGGILVSLKEAVEDRRYGGPAPQPGQRVHEGDAYHEAGHAVLAVLLGCDVQVVTALPGFGSPAPHVRCTPPESALPGGGTNTAEVAFLNVVLAGAGPAAERRYCGLRSRCTEDPAFTRQLDAYESGDLTTLDKALATLGWRAQPRPDGRGNLVDPSRSLVLSAVGKLFTPGATVLSEAVDAAAKALAERLCAKGWLDGRAAAAIVQTECDRYGDFARTCDQLPGIAEGLVSAALGVGLAAGRQR